MRRRKSAGLFCLATTSALCLSGCLMDGTDAVEVQKGQPNFTAQEADESLVISGLYKRNSVIPSGSAYDKIAQSVLAANSRSSEAELRSARLRQVAADKNWLPSIGPQVSLTSFGKVVAQMVVEQVIYDNGRKKAERAFAKADVEVAAVALAEDTNTRVFIALSLYTKSQQGKAEAQVARRALARMREFERVMTARVDGGVSDYSELAVINQKTAQLQAKLSAAEQISATALAELNAMAATPITDVTGVTALKTEEMSPERALTVVRSSAEKERSIAAAQISRAGLLPGLSATGVIDDGGSSGQLTVKSDQGFGFGTGANLKAVEASKDAAEQSFGQSKEDAARRIRSLSAREGALLQQVSDSKSLEGKARETYGLFEDQYEAGHRTVMDVVGVFETLTRIEQETVDLAHEKALVQLELAKEMGVLVNGADI